jgi:hypothetical protein
MACRTIGAMWRISARLSPPGARGSGCSRRGWSLAAPEGVYPSAVGMPISPPLLRAVCPRQNTEKYRDLKKSHQGPATCELLPRSRCIFVCGAWFPFGGVTMCKTHLDKTLDPTPFLSSSAPSLSAWGSAYGWPLSRTPPLGAPTRLYVPLLPTWHGLALGGLPRVKDAPVPSSMAARSPSRDPSTKRSFQNHRMWVSRGYG